MNDTLRSGALADAAGVNRQTLRYYERRGLLAEPVRSPGGHRLYPAQALTLLRVIKTAQRLGFTLDEVADLVEGERHRHGHRPGTERDHGLHARASRKLAETEARIADLQAVAATLRTAIDAGCDDLIECAAIDWCPLPFTDHDGTDHDGTDHDGTDHDGTDHDGGEHDGTDHDGGEPVAVARRTSRRRRVSTRGG